MKDSIKTDMKFLEKMKDNEIDYSDIPKTNKSFWYDAKAVYEKKVNLTVQVDKDIADWLNELGDIYSQTVNAVLRSYYYTLKELQK